MMKKIGIVLVCLLVLTGLLPAQKTVVSGTLEELIPGKRQAVNLQQIAAMARAIAMADISADKKFYIETEVEKSGFYRLNVMGKSFFIYLNPGDSLNLEEKDGRMIVSGKGWMAENQLMFDNQEYQDEYYRLPVPVRTGFGEGRAEGSWKAYQLKMKALKKADVRPEFKEKYRGFAGVEYWKNMTGGLGVREEGNLSSGYYKAVKRVKLTEAMVNHGEWYDILNTWLTYNLRKKNIRLTTYENWLKETASFIPDKGLREAYLVRQIELEVLRGEFVGLPEAVDAVEKMIRKPENEAKVKEQMELMEKNYARYSQCLPGTDLGDFEFSDREGKTVKLGDLKEKYVYIDVWSTGCLPCKQEIPFLAKLEKAMEKRNIIFVSISLDTKNEVWQKFIREKNLGGLQLITEKGFKHPFCATMGMGGIPQFILLDKDSKVINFNAKRPSNPVLWNYLDGIVD